MKEVKVLAQEFMDGVHDKALREIYLDEEQIPRQRSRYAKALQQYEALYGPGKRLFTALRAEVRLPEIIRIISTEEYWRRL